MIPSRTMKRLLIIGIVLLLALVWIISEKKEKSLGKETSPPTETVSPSEPEEKNEEPPETDSEDSEDFEVPEASEVPVESVSLAPNETIVTNLTPQSTTVTPQTVTRYHTTEVKVFLYEWGIDISQKEIFPGNIVFEVNNNGTFSHDFAIQGVKNFGKVIPGETQTFSYRILGAGEYVLLSPRERDMGKGMNEVIRILP